ncbi:hypothetical protein K450DRAFT_203290, partial [Umbelopsis ramanniana AG]
QNYSVQEIEALAIVWGIKKFRPFLEYGHFTVFTDHSSLQWLLRTKEEKQGRLARWASELQSYSFVVKYIPGKSNFVPDMLSRNPLPTISAITSADVTINWEAEQTKDQQLQRAITDSSANFVQDKNVWYRVVQHPRSPKRNRLLLVIPTHLQQEVIRLNHDPLFSGHLGAHKTYNRFKSYAWWLNAKQDTLKFVTSCTQCQQAKGHSDFNVLPRQTTGERPFQRVAMDLFGPLPPSDLGNRYVLVMQDTFTKFVEIYPLVRADAPSVLATIVDHFIPRHGVSNEFLSDNGPPFDSSFVQSLVIRLGGSHIFSPAYHPQSNGLVERMMGTLRTMLTIFCTGANWDKHLRQLRWAYNSSYHPTVQDSPFFLCHGRDPPTHFAAIVPGSLDTFEHL